ncbi:ThiF family adenylyltransferase [Nocardioides sp.]|uniref:ThiF family adenylyltransferase n=1 Tax=Nocardioides sp. TaxID=35761 RepID=UPI002CFCEF51|nr:ThiF family adenylyltransferase [Nocardioides sp.]HSX65927.1 ThiF family adenylyltransferase [Nocardioides sp.]
MSSLPTAPDEQIAQLVADGYDMVLESGHLVVRRLPYVGPSGLRRDGRLVLPVTMTGGVVADASGDHRIWFAGEEPRDERGQNLGTAGQNHGFANGEVADYMLSFKPPSGAYACLRDKIQKYAQILLGAARELDNTVADTPGGSWQVVPDNLPLAYADTNTTRAGLGKYSNLFRGHTIAIVGVGGTGSYILDQVAKTWVDRIVLIDGDRFENHNAFRAPGAAARDVVQAKPYKAEYFAREYSRMHTGITAHPVALTSDNLPLLEGSTFVFLAAADAAARPEIMQWLRDRGVPFIDVGMSFREGEGGLTGMAQVTAYLPGHDVSLPPASALPPGEDDYSSNIQVAELNALNAMHAVIEWKRYLGFYATHTAATQTVYKLFLNELRNGDVE